MELLNELSKLATLLMPIAGIISLVFLIIFLYKLIKFIINLQTSVDKVNEILDNSNKLVVKLQKPIDTVCNIFTVVDIVNSKMFSISKKTYKKIIRYFEIIVNFFKNLFKHKQEDKSSKQKKLNTINDEINQFFNDNEKGEN